MPRFYYLVLLTSISKHALKPSPLPTPPPKKKIFSSGIPNMRYFWWWFSSFSTPPQHTQKGPLGSSMNRIGKFQKKSKPSFFFWKIWFFIPTPYLSPTNQPMRDKTTYAEGRKEKPLQGWLRGSDLPDSHAQVRARKKNAFLGILAHCGNI